MTVIQGTNILNMRGQDFDGISTYVHRDTPRPPVPADSPVSLALRRVVMSDEANPPVRIPESADDAVTLVEEGIGRRRVGRPETQPSRGAETALRWGFRVAAKDLFRYLVPNELVFLTVRTFLGTRRHARSAVATLDYHLWPTTGQ